MTTPEPDRCVDATPDDPHPPAGRSDRCAYHHRHYDRWRDRRNKARKRPTSPYYQGAVRFPAYRPPARPSTAAGVLLDKTAADTLRSTHAALAVALLPATAARTAGRGLTGADLDRLTDAASHVVAHLDRALHPEQYE
jgi:hypothetical protein